jgi:HEAT repeat protein
MVEAMGDPNPVIRQAAATACSRFPRLLPMTVAELKQQEVFLPAGKEPVGVLINILGSRDPSLRKAAAVALGSLGPKAKAASAALKKAWELACTAGTDVLISPRSSHLGGTFAENQAVARAIAEARRKIDPIGTAEDEAAEQLKHAMKFEEGPQKENLLREIMQKYPRTSAAAWAEAMRKK